MRLGDAVDYRRLFDPDRPIANGCRIHWHPESVVRMSSSACDFTKPSTDCRNDNPQSTNGWSGQPGHIELRAVIAQDSKNPNSTHTDPKINDSSFAFKISSTATWSAVIACFSGYFDLIGTVMDMYGNEIYTVQITPKASMASATRTNPAMFAPKT